MSVISKLNDTIRVGSELDKGDRFREEFEIEAMEGDFTRRVTVIEEKAISRVVNGVEKLSIIRKLVPTVEHFTKGYMLYYPQGHSVFVPADDIEQLKLLGVPLDENDEVVLQAQSSSPIGLTSKEAVAKSESRRRRSTAGGIAEAMRE